MRDRPGERRWPSRGRLTASSPSAARAPPAGSAFRSRPPCGRVSWLLAWVIVTGPRACSDPAWGPAAGAPAGEGRHSRPARPGSPAGVRPAHAPLPKTQAQHVRVTSLRSLDREGRPLGKWQDHGSPRPHWAAGWSAGVSLCLGLCLSPSACASPCGGLCSRGSTQRGLCPSLHPTPVDGRLPPQEAAAFNPTRHLSSQSSDWILP